MKKILSACFVIYSFFSNAQTVQFENFESYTLGNLSASTNSMGQNDNFVGLGSVSDYQIKNIDPLYGKSLEISTNGSFSPHIVSKNFSAVVPNPGNTLVVAEYSFYTGNIVGTGGVRFTLYELDVNYIYHPVTTLFFDVTSGKFRGQVALMQGNNRIFKAIEFGNNSYPTNVWVNVSLSYDFLSGEYFWTTPEGNFSLTSAPVGYNLLPNLNVAKYEMTVASGNVNLKAGFDNINIFYSPSVLSTKEFEDYGVKSDLVVFPNPASDYLYLKSKGKISALKIFDASGKMVFEVGKFKEKINISELIKGTYTLTVKNTDGSSSAQRFVKK